MESRGGASFHWREGFDDKTQQNGTEKGGAGSFLSSTRDCLVVTPVVCSFQLISVCFGELRRSNFETTNCFYFSDRRYLFFYPCVLMWPNFDFLSIFIFFHVLIGNVNFSVIFQNRKWLLFPTIPTLRVRKEETWMVRRVNLR